MSIQRLSGSTQSPMTYQELEKIKTDASSIGIRLRIISSSSDGCELSMKSSLWINFDAYKKTNKQLSAICSALGVSNDSIGVLGPTVKDLRNINRQIQRKAFRTEKIYENITQKSPNLISRKISIIFYLQYKISKILNKSLRENFNTNYADYDFIYDGKNFRLDSFKHRSFQNFTDQQLAEVAECVKTASQTLLEDFDNEKFQRKLVTLPIYVSDKTATEQTSNMLTSEQALSSSEKYEYTSVSEAEGEVVSPRATSEEEPEMSSSESPRKETKELFHKMKHSEEKSRSSKPKRKLGQRVIDTVKAAVAVVGAPMGVTQESSPTSSKRRRLMSTQMLESASGGSGPSVYPRSWIASPSKASKR